MGRTALQSFKMIKSGTLHVILLVAATTTASFVPDRDTNVYQAVEKLQAGFGNLTAMQNGEFAALFAADGTWCQNMGEPCIQGRSNITNLAQSFTSFLGLQSSVSKFVLHSVHGDYGSFTNTWALSCNSKCGPRVCLMVRTGGVRLVPNTTVVQQLDEYVDSNEMDELCIGSCIKC